MFDRHSRPYVPMAEVNPYQSPQFFDPEAVPELADGAGVGVWRQGNLLVMHRGATLPDRCVKTNQPARGCRVRGRFYWHPPLLYLAIFIGLLVGYIILVFFFQHDADLQIPVNPQLHARRRRMTRIARFIGLGGWTLVIAGILFGLAWSGGFLFLIGIGVVVAGMVIDALAPKPRLSARRITRSHIWLSGVHPDFLAELPEWPYST